MRLQYFLAPLLLGGCMEEMAGSAPPPQVTDFNGYMVKVQYHPYALGPNYRESPVYDVARKTCGDGSDPKYQGVRSIGAYAGEHVFLCK